MRMIGAGSGTSSWSRLRWLAIAALATLACPPAIHAQVYTWVPSGTAAPGGTGTWNTAGISWWTGTSSGAVVWPNATTGTAVFGGVASGTVTLESSINAGLLRFTTSGYLLTGGTLTLGGAATIAVNTPVSGTATIASVIAGSAGLTQTGTGVLVLSGNNTYAGTTTISGGTLALGSAAALGSSAA